MGPNRRNSLLQYLYIDNPRSNKITQSNPPCVSLCGWNLTPPGSRSSGAASAAWTSQRHPPGARPSSHGGARRNVVAGPRPSIGDAQRRSTPWMKANLHALTQPLRSVYARTRAPQPRAHTIEPRAAPTGLPRSSPSFF